MDKICIVTNPDLSRDTAGSLDQAIEALVAIGCEVHRSEDDHFGSARQRTRIHDLKEALMTLTHVLRDLERGYRFDDEFADDKKKVLAKAVATLDQEGKIWLNVMGSKA